MRKLTTRNWSIGRRYHGSLNFTASLWFFRVQCEELSTCSTNIHTPRKRTDKAPIMVVQQVDKQNAMWSGICGMFLLVCGIGSVIAGSIWIHFHGYGGHGVWSGMFVSCS